MSSKSFLHFVLRSHMAKKVKKIVWFCGRNFIRAAWLGFLVLFFLSGIFFWRVHDRPWDVTFAKSYIEAALRDDLTGNHAELDKAVLYWPDLRGALFLEIKGAKVLDPDGVPIISVGHAAVSFSRVGLLSGRVMPKAIILKNPSIKLLRDSNGIGLDIGMSGQPQSQKQIDLSTRVFRHAAQPGRDSSSNSIISRLEAFSIEDARVIIDDKISQQTWSLPDFNFSAESTEIGLNAVLNVDLPEAGLETSRLSVDFDYIWDEKTVQLNGTLEAVDIKAIANKVPEISDLQDQDIVFDAEFNTILDEHFLPTDVRLKVHSDKGHISHPMWSDAPVPYSDMILNMSYNYPGKTLRFDETKIQFGDVPFSIAANITHTEDSAKGPVTLTIGDIQQSDVKPIWPKALEGDGTEVWIVQRMSEGRFKDLTARFDFIAEKQKPEENSVENKEAADTDMPETGWSFDVQNLIAEFKAEDMTIDYRSPLDKAVNTYGKGTYTLDDDELNIEVDRGKIGAMSANGAVFKFKNISKKGQGIADLSIPLKGGISDVLRYVAKEPINLGDKIGMKPSEVKGQADLKVTLNFPTRADVLVEDFKIGIDGTLTDVLFPDVIQKLDLSGGPLSFKVDKGDILLSGKGMLDNREMDFTWQTFLELKGKSYIEKIEAKITADPNLRQQFGIDLSDFLEGSALLDVRYVQKTRTKAEAQVFVDAEPARFFISPFGVEKPPGEAAKAEFTALFHKGLLQKIENLNVSGEGFAVDGAVLGFIQNSNNETELHSGRFADFTADQTGGDLDFVFDESGAVSIDLDAKTLDAQPLMEGESEDELSRGEDESAAPVYSYPAMRINARAENMLTAPGKSISNASVTLDIDAQGRYDIFLIHADMAEGVFRLDFDHKREGGPAFIFQSDNAGVFLSSFDVFNDMRGGTIEVKGNQDKDNPRSIVGRAKINNFKVVQAPALAKLVSFFSMGGLADTLAGEGLSFRKLESDFKWIYKPGGSLVEIKKGRTSGNSLGLLFDGTFNMRNGEVDVSGTAVPISGVNKFIGKIPLVGDILTGGSGGVFAATYSLKGTSEKLRVTVNPLAALAPGIVRRILFE